MRHGEACGHWQSLRQRQPGVGRATGVARVGYPWAGFMIDAVKTQTRATRLGPVGAAWPPWQRDAVAHPALSIAVATIGVASVKVVLKARKMENALARSTCPDPRDHYATEHASRRRRCNRCYWLRLVLSPLFL